MSTLTSAPYGYLFDQLVVVRASATNARGTGSTSTPNSSGAKIRSVPSVMSTPTKDLLQILTYQSHGVH